jgi:hypothetical protein
MRAFTIQIEVKAQTDDELQDVCNRLYEEMKQMYGNASSFGNVTYYELPAPIPETWGWTCNHQPGYQEDPGKRVPQRQPRTICIRLDEPSDMMPVKQHLMHGDPNVYFHSEGNPVTLWVDTKIDVTTIRKYGGVGDAIYSGVIRNA